MTCPWQCPHCFSIFQRPFLWIRVLPGVPWALRALRSQPEKGEFRWWNRDKALAPKPDRRPGLFARTWASAKGRWLPNLNRPLMPKKQRHSAYQCPFCRERLVQQPMMPSDWLTAVFLIRRFQCPHCFSFFKRPFAWLGYLPGVAWLSGKLSFGRGGQHARRGRDRDRQGGLTRAFAKTGQNVGKMERGIGRFFGGLLGILWKPFHWLTSLLFGSDEHQVQGGVWKGTRNRRRRRRSRRKKR